MTIYSIHIHLKDLALKLQSQIEDVYLIKTKLTKDAGQWYIVADERLDAGGATVAEVERFVKEIRAFCDGYHRAKNEG